MYNETVNFVTFL